MHEFFANSVRRWPDRIAVDLPPGHQRPQRRLTTYAELAREADAVAGGLADFARHDSIVAILLPRDQRLYSAQVGVLQAGAAYTTIDPSFPDGRIREILDDSAAVGLITDRASAVRARSFQFPGPILSIEDLPDRQPASLPRPDPANLAYVIYTSGTTGRRRG